MDVSGKGVHFDIFQFFQCFDLAQQCLNAYELIILIFEQFSFERVELIFGEEADIVHFVISQHAEIEISLLQFPQVLFEGLSILFVPEAVLEVDLIEIGYHILGLILAVVDLFDAVEDDSHDDLVGHDAGVVEEVLVALLDALYCRFQHVLRLGVDADADRQLYSSFGCSLEKR